MLGLQMPVTAPDSRQPRHDPELARALGIVGKAAAQLGAPRRVCLAVSGGPDSMAMLGLLHRLAHREGLWLGVAHVDHGLREASRREAQLVARVSDELGLEFATRRLELPSGPGLPARARQARHAALREMADGFSATTIALGHTATDQAETMLMHLTRGSGLDGLSGMPAFADGRWRPLLGLTRAQTRTLCGCLGLPFVDDPSNAALEHFRVRVREEVLPRLREQNPRIEASMLALSQRARDADSLIEELVDAEFSARLESAAGSGPKRRSEAAEVGQTHRITGYAEMHRELRTRWLRRVIERDAGSNLDGGRRIIEDIDRALCADAHAGRGFSPRRWALGAGRELWVARGRLGIGAADVSKP